MKKFLKWAAIVLGSLIVIVVITAFLLANHLDNMRKQKFVVGDSRIPIPSDSASVARGSYWAHATCGNCHGSDFSGSDFFNDPKLGYIHALNLTPGKGGIGATYSDEDWIRAIRHGVRKGGGGIMIMPTENFTNWGDDDLACIVAFLKTLPPVDQEWAPPHFTFMTRVIAGAGGFGVLYPASIIDHTKLNGKTAPAEGATTEYGTYLVKVTGCRSCHGEQLNGAQPGDPNSPFSPNISPGGKLGNWTNAQFIQTLRTGVDPDGRTLNPKFMPWLGISKLDDEMLSAIFLYLKSQPAVPDAPHKK